MFLEYQNPREAEEAVKGLDGHKLDKQHTFQVNLFTDFDKYQNIPDEWETPQPQPYKDPVIFFLHDFQFMWFFFFYFSEILSLLSQGNLKYWLMDKNGYDQFSVIYEGGARTAVYLNASSEPTVVEERAVRSRTICAEYFIFMP